MDLSAIMHGISGGLSGAGTGLGNLQNTLRQEEVDRLVREKAARDAITSGLANQLTQAQIDQVSQGKADRDSAIASIASLNSSLTAGRTPFVPNPEITAVLPNIDKSPMEMYLNSGLAQNTSAPATAYGKVFNDMYGLPAQKQALDEARLNKPDAVSADTKARLAFDWAKLKSDKENKGKIFSNTEDGNNMLEDYVDRIYNGEANPDMKDLSTRGVAGANARLQAQSKMKELHPEFDIEKEKTAYSFWNNPKNLQQRNAMDVVSEQIPKLIEAAKGLKASGLPVFDRATLEARRATGDVNAANYLAAFTATIEDVAKATAGGNAVTNDQLSLANNLLYKGGTTDQTIALAQQIQNAVDSRKLVQYVRGGLQAKKYAAADPFLDDDTREKIISGQIKEKDISGGGLPKVNNADDYAKIPANGYYINVHGEKVQKGHE